MGFRRYAALDVLDSHLARPGEPLIKDAHRHEFDYVPKPGFLYARSRAISSRCNDNFDEFPADEIRKGWRTFIGKPVFVNHHNNDPKRARGVIVDAALHEDVNPDGTEDVWVETLHEIDARKFPKLCQAILAGESDRTSMGTNVEYSLCSFCGNKAYTPLDYCQHIPRMKGQRIYRHNASTGRREGVLVREICYGLSFFENSHLVEPPADPTAYVLGIDTRGIETTSSRRTAAKVEPPSDVTGWVPILNWFIEYNRGKKDPEGKYVDPDAFSYSDIAYGLNLARSRGSGMLDMALRNLDRDALVVLVNRIHDEMGYRNITQGAVAQWVYQHADEIIGVRAENTQSGQGSMIFPHNSKLASRVAMEQPAWMRGHEGHEVVLISVSAGEKAQCETCKKVIAWWPDDSAAPMTYIPSNITYTSKLGYGETLAPAEVDTLRDATCPVCGEDDTYNGDECLVCGFRKPPDQFLDPDLEKAKQVDLRQDQQEEAAGEGNPGSDQPLDHFVPPDSAEAVDEPVDEAPDDEDDEDDDEEDDSVDPSDVKKKKDKKKSATPPKQSHREGVDVTMRPTLAALAEQQIILDSQQAQINAIAELAGVDLSQFHTHAQQRVAALRRQADENNPAQPVPDPASEAATETTDQALAPDGRDDPTNIGASPVTDVSADATTDVQGTSTVLDQPLDLNEKDPTKPVAGTEGPRPVSEVRTETEVRVGNPSDTGTAFPLEGDFARQPTVGQRNDGRFIASLRLARLRMHADIAGGVEDDIALATSIDHSDMTDDGIAGEIETLSKVVTAQQSREPRATVARRLVPQPAASSIHRTTPSLVATASGDGPPSQEALHTASLSITSDEMLFESD